MTALTLCYSGGVLVLEHSEYAEAIIDGLHYSEDSVWSRKFPGGRMNGGPAGSLQMWIFNSVYTTTDYDI